MYYLILQNYLGLMQIFKTTLYNVTHIQSSGLLTHSHRYVIYKVGGNFTHLTHTRKYHTRFLPETKKSN